MNNSERFANLLMTTEGQPELRRDGLMEFEPLIKKLLELENLRLLAMEDGSFVLDQYVSEELGHGLSTFEDSEELASSLVDMLGSRPQTALALIQGIARSIDEALYAEEDCDATN